jgi:hypothetical protein
VELYLHSSVRLHGLVISSKSTGTTLLYFTFLRTIIYSGYFEPVRTKIKSAIQILGPLNIEFNQNAFIYFHMKYAGSRTGLAFALCVHSLSSKEAFSLG